MTQNGVFFEDVTEGMPIKSLAKKSSMVSIFMYQAATWNCDRIHYDSKFAQEVFGLPDVVQTGPVSADWYAQILTEWMGETGLIKKLSYQSRLTILPEDKLVCGGKVIRKYTHKGYHCIDCDLTLVNQRGENTSPGKATIILPLKGKNLDFIQIADETDLFLDTSEKPIRLPGTLVTSEILKLIGVEAEPVTSDPITAKEIKRYALAIGDPNPLYHDEEKAKKSRYGGLIAPFGYALWACHPVSQDDFAENLTPGGYPKRQAAFYIPKLPVENLVHGGDEHEFFHPIRPGDVLTGSTKVFDISEKIGKTRSMIFVDTETTVKDQNNKLVDIFKVTAVFY